MNVFQLIKSDFQRYKATGGKSNLKIIFFNQGFFYTSVFRINTSLYNNFKKIPVLNKLIGLYNLIWLKRSQRRSGLSMPVGLKIGKGLFISHSGSIIINSQCVIGENCNIAPMVVIGWGKNKGVEGFPVIGDRVWIGPGAKIFGPITIGNDVAIGANAVVNFNVPENSTVVGNPAKIIENKGSSEYIKY